MQILVYKKKLHFVWDQDLITIILHLLYIVHQQIVVA